MSARHFPLHRLIPVLPLVVGLWVGAARAADNYDQVQQLLETGKSTQALQQADSYIAAHPNDPQMRFLRAAALQAAGRMDEAEAVLTQLTRDYPELAEPWNNLAVLYAARGQLDMARTALQAALRIDPNYATALENLGDLNVRLALRRYQQALQADPGASARLSAKIDAAQRVADAASAPQPAASQLAASPTARPQTAASSQPASATSGAASPSHPLSTGAHHD